MGARALFQCQSGARCDTLAVAWTASLGQQRRLLCPSSVIHAWLGFSAPTCAALTQTSNFGIRLHLSMRQRDGAERTASPARTTARYRLPTGYRLQATGHQATGHEPANSPPISPLQACSRPCFHRGPGCRSLTLILPPTASQVITIRSSKHPSTLLSAQHTLASRRTFPRVVAI